MRGVPLRSGLCRSLAKRLQEYTGRKRCVRMENWAVFEHPVTKTIHSILATRPLSSGPPFGVGCWVCNAEPVSDTCPYATLSVNSLAMMCRTRFVHHARSPSHQEAHSRLQLSAGVRDPTPSLGTGDVAGNVSLTNGLGAAVPRVEKWVLAGSILECHGSYEDFERQAESLRLGSNQISDKSDSGRGTMDRLVTCAAQPLHEKDRAIMRSSIKASIALDDRDQILMIFARILCPTGLYEFFVGLGRDYGHGPEQTADEIKRIIERAAEAPKGRQLPGQLPQQLIDKEALNNFRLSIFAGVQMEVFQKRRAWRYLQIKCMSLRR